MAGLVSPPGTAAAAAFRVTDLGTLGGVSSEATAMNGSDQVVGDASRADGTIHAFSWTRGGGIVDLGTFGGPRSHAADVNAAGVVVGYALTATGLPHAYSWTSGGGMVDLGTLGGSYSYAVAVNDKGVVVGASDVGGGGGFHAFVWQPGDAKMTDLGTVGGAFSWAWALNESNQVVGWATDSDGDTHAFSWTAASGIVDVAPGPRSTSLAVNGAGEVVGSMYSSDFLRSHAFSWTAGGGLTDLGTFGGRDSSAAAVNDAGQVVGWASLANGSQHAASWTSGGGVSDLGTLGGGYSSAVGINAAGQIVGTAATSAGSQHAFLRSPGGSLIDLGTLGGASSAAVDINAAGHVAGWGEGPGGSRHATLITPVTPYEDLEAIANGLPTTSKPFVDAKARLAQALDRTLWNSTGTALTYPDGSRFFDSVKQAVDRLDKANDDAARRAISDLWAVAEPLTASAVTNVDVAQRQLDAARSRWAVDHSDAFERLKQAWRSAEAAVR